VSAASDACPTCGSSLPPKSRFCPKCGARVGAAPGETAVQEAPRHEERPAPVDVMWAERRLFGVPSSTALFGLGIGALVLAVVLAATGNALWALLALATAVLALTGFVSQTRRLPAQASGVARASVQALEAVKARAEATIDTVAAHGNARIELMRLRRETGPLAEDRERKLRDLGEAVYKGDRQATKELKEQIRELDDQVEAKEEQMAQVTQQADERIRQAQLQVQPTQIAQGEEAPEAPEPARVPEPFPPPDEGEPPQPVRIPEPFPPPDEGDRPQQPAIPEPGPEGGTRKR
jgi:zinc ribbon protein